MIFLLFSAVLSLIISASSMNFDYREEPMEAERRIFYPSNDDGMFPNSETSDRGILEQLINTITRPFVTIFENEEADMASISFRHYLIGENAGREIKPNCYYCLKGFIVSAPTVFIVHGYQANGTSEFPNNMRTAFEKRSEPLNIVVVDWRHLADNTIYSTSAIKTKTVGKYIALMITYLVQQNVASYETITYAGHSLGAQTANFVANNLFPHKIDRIFALDPAGPGFDYSDDTSERIDPSDANFVIAVHTSAGQLLTGVGYLGINKAVGHVDFWPNGGQVQPGCDSGWLADTRTSCSHSRSHQLLVASIIYPKAFPACKCDSYYDNKYSKCDCNYRPDLYFNWDISKWTEGEYYFETKGNYPYGINL